MTLTLGTVITASRDRSPAFSRTLVTDAVIARFLSDMQNELIAKAVIRDRQYVAQSAVISIAMDGNDAPGVTGAGTSGGLPGTSSNGVFSTSAATTGSLVEVGVTTAEGAIVLVSETPVTSATATTLTKTLAARTVNADVGRLLVITQGTGAGQRRQVLSNTATVWTISTGSDNEQWAIVPDATSQFTLVAPVMVSDDTAGAVTGLPSVTTSQGYLVRTAADGTPFIDYAQPLTATVEQGVPLPSMQALLPDLCQYWPVDANGPRRLCVTTAQRRFAPEHVPAVYQIGSTLYLAGVSGDWSGVRSIELRYVPVAPAFTALTDLFLLPDAARGVLVALAAEFMAVRVEGVPQVTIDAAAHAAMARRAEAEFLRAVLLGKRGRVSRVREDW